MASLNFEYPDGAVVSVKVYSSVTFIFSFVIDWVYIVV